MGAASVQETAGAVTPWLSRVGRPRPGNFHCARAIPGPVGISQAPCPLPTSRRVPSAENARSRPDPEATKLVQSRVPLRGSHSRTPSSCPTVASKLPSPKKVRLLMFWRFSFRSQRRSWPFHTVIRPFSSESTNKEPSGENAARLTACPPNSRCFSPLPSQPIRTTSPALPVATSSREATLMFSRLSGKFSWPSQSWGSRWLLGHGPRVHSSL